MYHFLHYIILVFTFLITPVFLWISCLYKKRFQEVVLSWRKPRLMVFTIVCFILNLGFFFLICFFFGGYLGRVEGIRVIDFSGQVMKTLSFDCFFMVCGISMLYMAVQNFYTQFITKKGICFPNFDILEFKFAVFLLRWEKIK